MLTQSALILGLCIITLASGALWVQVPEVPGVAAVEAVCLFSAATLLCLAVRFAGARLSQSLMSAASDLRRLQRNAAQRSPVQGADEARFTGGSRGSHSPNARSISNT